MVSNSSSMSLLSVARAGTESAGMAILHFRGILKRVVANHGLDKLKIEIAGNSTSSRYLPQPSGRNCTPASSLCED
jgi:hypothetical protein